MAGWSWLAWKGCFHIASLLGWTRQVERWTAALVFIGRAHSPELTNIYISFSVPLPPLSEFVFLVVPTWMLHLQLSFLGIVLGSPCTFFISMIIIFLNLNASLCSVTWHSTLLSCSPPGCPLLFVFFPPPQICNKFL